MRSFTTSYHGLFVRRNEDAPEIDRIKIPLIQRDYAQGRDDREVRRIRREFLDVLCRAVCGGEPVGLDFVYGEMDGDRLIPLDGQQRLTTLFLLHWYLAVRTGQSVRGQAWTRFSYATRPSARRFCERLAEYQPPTTVPPNSEWIEDQPWYLATWRHDPTVGSMRVMLDAIHQQLGTADCEQAWARLIDPARPAISFQLLPIEWTGRSDELYIKMNSRGKPLTAFEHFKARFEQSLNEWRCPRVAEFASLIDGAWSDLMWPFRGDDDIVDDEFMRYIRFITEVCIWQAGTECQAGDLAALAECVYGPGNARRDSNLGFLFDAFNTWVGLDIPALFGGLFSADDTGGGQGQVVLFGLSAPHKINLFEACCRDYGEVRGPNRVFSLAQTLLFYGVLLQRLHATPEVPRRLRVLRNLIEASGNEIRLERMTNLLADVRLVVVDRTLNGVSAFNQAQVADERLKEALLARCPGLEAELFRLEDHRLLRGCLAAFELDVAVFAARADTFTRLFADQTLLPELTGALLATGDYSRRLNPRSIRLGSSKETQPWRDLLTGTGRGQLSSTRAVLGDLLDRLAQAQVDFQTVLSQVGQNWLNATAQSTGLDWRWYLVRYPAMRDGRSGVYFGLSDNAGYNLCMLDKVQMNSWYRDPYLSAIHLESAVGDAVEPLWFTGYETQPRWLRLATSGAQLRCVAAGLQLEPPVVDAHRPAFAAVCVTRGIGADYLLMVPQVARGGVMLDAQDRVALGATLLRELVAAGL